MDGQDRQDALVLLLPQKTQKLTKGWSAYVLLFWPRMGADAWVRAYVLCV